LRCFFPTSTSNLVPGDEGRRFLVNIVVEETAPSPVTMLLNWPAALKASQR
jgi:hypothetical protein